MSRSYEAIPGQPGYYLHGRAIAFRYTDPLTGRRLWASVKGSPTKRTLAAAAKIKAQLDAGVLEGKRRRGPTFRDYATPWIETYAGRSNRGIDEATRDDYRRSLEQDAIPYFGDKPLAAIDVLDVKGYIAKLGAERTPAELKANPRLKPRVSRSTVKRGFAVIHALFADAREEGLLTTNPAQGVRVNVKRAASTQDRRALTESELAALLEQLPEESGLARWRLFARFLAETGMRAGEAAEIRFRDVDLGRGYVTVQRAWKLNRGRQAAHVGEPKTSHGKRTIRLSPGMQEAIWALRKERRAGDHELLFTGCRGERISHSYFSKVLKQAAEAAGIGDWIGWHTLRHTSATVLLRHGANPVQTQKHLGHHSAAFTLATYVHLLEPDMPDVGFWDHLEERVAGDEAEIACDQNATAPSQTGARPRVVPEGEIAV
jgi:integrase